MHKHRVLGLPNWPNGVLPLHCTVQASSWWHCAVPQPQMPRLGCAPPHAPAPAGAQALRAIASAAAPYGGGVLFYLAAAVSDFYIPWSELVRRWRGVLLDEVAGWAAGCVCGRLMRAPPPVWQLALLVLLSRSSHLLAHQPAPAAATVNNRAHTHTHTHTQMQGAVFV